MIGLTRLPIDPRALEDAVAHPGAGAVLTFLGVTRDRFEGRAVVRLEYEAYETMALAQLAEIVAEVASQWPGARAAIVHRLGVVPLGETSVAIVVATPHRDAAYAASRHAIEALKARVPIWKKEIYEDGSAWKANAPTPSGG
ncbi:MAG: molybdenum cofactor biosynthesis protein MoaE [Alphaproteobacteria bacterium]|nr:molybdenum cofactor biosynthesis protein MoaE [Alphaproteobacteria bacterium]